MSKSFDTEDFCYPSKNINPLTGRSDIIISKDIDLSKKVKPVEEKFNQLPQQRGFSDQQ